MAAKGIPPSACMCLCPFVCWQCRLLLDLYLRLCHRPSGSYNYKHTSTTAAAAADAAGGVPSGPPRGGGTRTGSTSASTSVPTSAPSTGEWNAGVCGTSSGNPRVMMAGGTSGIAGRNPVLVSKASCWRSCVAAGANCCQIESIGRSHATSGLASPYSISLLATPTREMASYSIASIAVAPSTKDLFHMPTPGNANNLMIKSSALDDGSTQFVCYASNISSQAFTECPSGVNRAHFSEAACLSQVSNIGSTTWVSTIPGKWPRKRMHCC